MAEAFVSLFGATLSGKEGDVETATALEGKAAVGVYYASAASAEFSATLAQAYEALSGKGLELVLISCDDSEEAAQATLQDLPGLALPEDQKAAVVEKFELTDAPRLVILDQEGAVITAEGVEKVTEDPDGANFPWKAAEEAPTLSEDEILLRMENMTPDPGESGLKGVFLNSKNYVNLGLVNETAPNEKVAFSGFKLKPYVLVNKEGLLLEVKKMGIASDWQPYSKELNAFPGPEILLIADPERTYGEKVIMAVTQEAFDREYARFEAKREEIITAFEREQKGEEGEEGGVDGANDEDAAEENITVRDLPRDCKEWISDTAEATHMEVSNFTVQNMRPLMKVMITRPRLHFGKPCKFSDSGENLHNCRPQKDPNYALHRKELDIGVQAVREVLATACQTTWYRPVNKSTQYSPGDFLPKDAGRGYDKVDELTEFLSAVSVTVEEALQTNETVDIFQEEFAHLGEEETGDVSKASPSLQEIRTFTDVGFTKGKRVEWIEWVPNSTDMLVASYCENLHFCDKLDMMSRAGNSSILIWSFQDSLAPHANLVAPWEVTVFKFYPSDHKYVIGGLASGQIVVWKLSDADLGYAMREKAGKHGAGEEEKNSSVPSIAHKVLSIIDDSHKKPVVAIEFLPATLELEKRGRGASEKNAKDGPVKYFITIAGDGQVMIWDFQAVLEAVNDSDIQWRPAYKVQLQRQDSGTEMGCCQIVYCHDRVDEKKNKMLTNFFASTEEGELIFGDWAAPGGEDRKPEFVKQLFTVSKTFRPMLSLERSPFFSDLLLAVTDWAFYLFKDALFKDGIKEHLFQSSYTSTPFTRGVWSPTRPSVIFLGLASGAIDIWDFSDQSHKASLSVSVTSLPISSMCFLRHGDLAVDQKLAVGDAGGNTHVHVIPKNLVRQAGKEFENMGKFLKREEARVRYFQSRKQELATEKEQIEKQAQMMSEEKDEGDKGKATVDVDKADAAAEEAYQKLQAECLEELKGM